MKRTFALVVGLLTAGMQVPGEETPRPVADVMTMVQDARCKQVVVTCLVAGRPMRMMLDTGASHTVLHRESATALKEARLLDTSQVEFRGNAQHRPALLAAPLQAGPGKFAEHVFLVLDLSAVRGAMAERVDGILGMDVLGRLPFTFDQRRGEFYWGVPQKVAAVPLNGQIDSYGRLVVEAECGERRLKLLLDTGSSVTRLPAELWPAGEAGETTVQVGDVNEAAQHRMQKGKAADMLVAPGVVLEGVTPLLTSAGEGISLLGMDALRQVMLIHAPTEKSPFGLFFVAR